MFECPRLRHDKEDGLPFGSIHELLPTPPHAQPGWVSWLGLSPWVQTAIKPPAFILGDCPAALSAYYHSQIGEADTGLYRLRDTAVTGSGMIVHDAMLVACNQLGHSTEYCKGQMRSGRLRGPDGYARRRVDRAVLLLCGGYDVYGHWLVDIMPKLFALRLAGFDLGALSFLYPSDTQPFGAAWLGLAGIGEDQLIRYDPTSEIVLAEELLVPTLLRSGSRASSLFGAAADFLLDAIDRNASLPAEQTGPNAILISRARAGRDGRAMRNRQAIEAMIMDAGYVAVHPEHLPITRQVALFRGATRIIGEYGSGLHGSIFSPKGSRVCSLRGAARHPGFLQSGLAQALGQECGYVLGAASLDAIDFEFHIEPADLRQALALLSLPEA